MLGLRGVHSLGLFLFTIALPFCGPKGIDHYFCAMYPLLKLACPDAHKMGFLVIVNSIFMGPGIFMLLTAYSAEGHSKALPVSSSHVTIAILFFTPIIFVYVRPATTFPECLHSCAQLLSPCLTLLSTHSTNMEMKNTIRKLSCPERFEEGKQ